MRKIDWTSHHYDFLFHSPEQGPAGGHRTGSPAPKTIKHKDISQLKNSWLNAISIVFTHQATIRQGGHSNISIFIWFGLACDPDLTNQYCSNPATAMSSEAGKIWWEPILSLLLKQAGKRSSFPSLAKTMVWPLDCHRLLQWQPEKETSSQVSWEGPSPDIAMPEAVPPGYDSWGSQSSPFLKPVLCWISATCEDV